MKKIKLSQFDKIINAISPSWGAQRVRSKMYINAVSSAEGYVTPASDKRSMYNWNPTATTADAAIVPKLEEMRAASRDSAMNNPIAVAALERVEINAIGSGLMLQSQLEWEFLGMTEDAGTNWIKNTEREFDNWAKSKECDIQRVSNFYQLQAQALYNAMLDGDCFSLFPFVKRPRQKYDMRIHLITAAMCTSPIEYELGANDSDVVAGIKRDRFKSPIAYFFQKESNNSEFELNTNKHVEIQAYSKSGKKMVHHIFIKKLLNQTRGIVFFAPAMEPLKQIKTLSDSELMSSIIASFFTVFLKDMPAGVQGFQASGLKQFADPTYEGDDVDKPREKINLAPGAVIPLRKGEDIEIAESKRPNANFEAFYYSYVKQVGSCLNIPFEELILHFQSSYSAARAAILKAWKFYMTRREWIATEFCQVTYEDWLEHAILKGVIEAPGFFDDESIRFAYTNAKWEGSSMGQIDPLKEINASEKAIDLVVSDRETEAKKLHGSKSGRWSNILKRAAAEKKALEAAGLNSNTSNDSGPETIQKTEDEEEE